MAQFPSVFNLVDPNLKKTRFSGHQNSHLLRPMAKWTKQTAGTYMWEWAQQLHLVINQASSTHVQARAMNGLCSYLMMITDPLSHWVVRPLCLSLD